MTFNICKPTPYSEEELCNQIKVFNVMLVEKGKASSGSQRQSSLLGCFNVGMTTSLSQVEEDLTEFDYVSLKIWA